MDQNKKSKIPSELSLTAVLSSGLTLVLSVTYTVLCILALVYRFQCDAGLASGTPGSNYFINTVYRVYIQGDWCGNPESSAPGGVPLVSAHTVFIFVVVTLVLSVLACAAAVVLIVVVVDEKKSQYIFATAWVYICVCFSAIVVDLVLAILFGLDYADLTALMDKSLPGIIMNYRYDVLRMGTLLFMAIALKGYLAHVFNAVLLVLLLVQATKFRNQLQAEEHSIHKRGAINAYEPHLNPGFVHDEEPRRSPRSPLRAAPHAPISDYSNRDYDRSEPWQQARPFSYVDRGTPSPREPWRRDRDPWAPPVPAPDYSPPARRLKSALKSNYI